MARHIMLNGEIIPSSSPCLAYNNRGLLYGDCFSFEMRGNSSKVFLLDEYFDYMISAISYYRMQRPKLLKKSIFEKDIELLLQKNRIYKEFSVLITVFRNGTNPKLAIDNTVSLLMSVEALPCEYFELNEKGLKIDIPKSYNLPEFIINNKFNSNSYQELLLNEEIKNNAIDDILLLNEKGCIVKASDSNVFFVKKGNLIVPQKIQDNYQKIFSQYIEILAVNLNIHVISFDVRATDLYDIDEIFLVNPVFGIKWVLAYKEKRYFNKISSLLTKELDKELRKVTSES